MTRPSAGALSMLAKMIASMAGKIRAKDEDLAEDMLRVADRLDTLSLTWDERDG